ncbi:Histone acetyltransferase KAT6B, partial [Stegodyphus mimosarum]
MHRKEMREERLQDEGSDDEEGNSSVTKWLIDAIRKVKFQKQRPCLDRIYSVVRQRHKVDHQTVVEHLEKAVAKGLILKVYTKGLYSYKDPRTMCNLKSRTLRIHSGTDMTKVIVKAIKELGENGGSTLRSIEKYVRQTFTLSVDPGTDLAQQLLQSAKRATSNGLIIQDGRNYRLRRMPFRRASTDSAASSNVSRGNQVSNSSKKIHQGSMSCTYCKESSMTKNGRYEGMLICCVCGVPGHPSCCGLLPEAMKQVKEAKWECSRCKICVVCGVKTENKRMLCCNLCDKGYHATCVRPVFPRPARGKWRCDMCKKKTMAKETNHINRMAANVKERYKKRNLKLNVGRKLKRESYSVMKNSKHSKKLSRRSSDSSSDDNTVVEQKSTLPPGVTDSDVNLFKNVQDTALQSLAQGLTAVDSDRKVQEVLPRSSDEVTKSQAQHRTALKAM